MHFQHSLSAVNSSFSVRAHEYALTVADYAAEYGTELTMFHGVESAAGRTAPQVIIAARTEPLDKLISDNQHKHLNVRTAVRCSQPDEEIVGYAKKVHAHLLVMTARGDALDRGSTTYRVIQLGPAPVLAIHTGSTSN